MTNSNRLVRVTLTPRMSTCVDPLPEGEGNGSGARFALLLVAGLCCAAVAAASDWPCYRGPNGDGIVVDELAAKWPADGPRKLWSVPLRDDGAGTHAGPSIVSGRVYVPGKSKEGEVENDVVYCFDANSGAEIWHYSYAAPGRNDEVYGTGIRIQPTVDEQRVYTLGCYGQLVCLDREHGTLVWRRDVLEEFNGKPPSFGMSAAPLVAGDLLICETGGGKAVLAALDKRTGKTVWEAGDDGASYATPQTARLAGVEQVVVFLASGLSGFELKTGRLLWTYPFPDERRKNVPAPLIDKDRIYLANNSLGFNALDISQEHGVFSARKVWSSRGAKMHFSCPVIGATEDKCLYFHDGKREVKCLALANGAINWGAPNMGREEAVLVRLGAHHLLAAPDSGEIVLLQVSASGFVETGRFRAFEQKEKLYVQPSVADGRLYVRDHVTLDCYDLRAPADGAPLVTRIEHAAAPSKIGSAVSAAPINHAADLKQAWNTKKSLFIVLALAGVTLAILGTWLLSRNELGAGALACESAALGLALVAWARAAYPEAVKTTLARHNWLHGASAEKELALCFGTLAALLALLWLGRRAGGAWKLFAAGGLLAAPLLWIQMKSQGTADISYILFSTEVRDTRSGFNDLVTNAGGLILFLAAVRTAFLQRRALLMLGLAGIVTGFAAGTAVQLAGALFAGASVVFPALALQELGVLKRSAVAAALTAAVLIVVALLTALSLGETLRQPPAPLAAAVLCAMWFCAAAFGWITRRSALTTDKLSA